jgi:hypothetical protein
MKALRTGFFRIARTIAIAVVLLYAPVLAVASDSISLKPVALDHGSGTDHQAANTVAEAPDHHDLPSDEPLHCHLKSPQPIEVGPAQSVTNHDLAVLSSPDFSSTKREKDARLPLAWQRIPIPAPPGFILFGNFRS